MRIRKPYRIFATIAAVFFLTGCDAGHEPITAPVTIVAFGDSLTAGYSLPADEAFPVQLENRFRRDGSTGVRVINQGISGDTTQDGLARLHLVLEAEPDIVILELGANDILRARPATKARENLARIITELQSKGISVLLTGIKISDAFSSANKNVGDYKQVFSGLSEEYGLAVYGDFLKGVRSDRALNLPDGLHPNAKGVAAIVENIYPTVRKLAAEAASRKTRQ